MLYTRHPRGNVNLFTEQLESSLSKIENDRTIKHSILTGDCNIDLIEFDINNNTNEYLNTVIKNGFIPVILLSTRVTSYTCTLIGHIFCLSRNSRIQVSSGNLITDMSDHFANFLILRSSAKSKLTNRPKVRIFSNKSNKNNFKRLIGEIKWEKELIDKNTIVAVLIFNKKLCSAFSFFPLYLVLLFLLSRKCAKDKPWITSGLNTKYQTETHIKNTYPIKQKKTKLSTNYIKTN